jgi:hypothetical protein
VFLLVSIRVFAVNPNLVLRASNINTCVVLIGIEEMRVESVLEYIPSSGKKF